MKIVIEDKDDKTVAVTVDDEPPINLKDWQLDLEPGGVEVDEEASENSGGYIVHKKTPAFVLRLTGNMCEQKP